MVRKKYGVEVRQVTYAKREHQSTNNFYNSDRSINTLLALGVATETQPNKPSPGRQLLST